MGKIVVLDFDGVIADSINECFLVSCLAYEHVEKVKREMLNIDGCFAKEAFARFRYLVEPANEYYYLIKTLHDRVGAASDIFVGSYEKNKLLYHEKSLSFCDDFFSIRKQVQCSFPREWIMLNPIYKGVKDSLDSLAKECEIFISSTKDEASIELILKQNNLNISKEHILGNSFGTHKPDHFVSILHRTGELKENICFVDDNINHLVKVQSVGIRCFMAGWGYNTEQMHRQANEMGFKVLTIDELKKMEILYG